MMIGAGTIFGIVYYPFLAITNNPMVGMLGLIPVVLFAWFCGKSGGTISAIIICLVYYSTSLIYDPHSTLLTWYEPLIGCIGFIGIGFIIGYTRELNFCLMLEANKRQNAENQLTIYKDHLEEMVEKRTEAQEQSLEHHRQSQKMEAIGQLAGGIAHDFNNILGGIIGFADLIKRKFGPENPTLDKYITSILESSERAASLTAKLVAFAQKGKYHVVAVNMHEIVAEVINLLEHAIDKRILISQQLNAPTPIVKGDRSQLQDVVLNLAINGRDAMPEGGELSFASEEVDIDEKYCATHADKMEPGAYLMLSVTDNGIGMDKQTQSRIFEPFFTTKELGKGTGMGLASAYGIIKNHHGSIEVYSTKGKGTSFKIYLQIYDKEIEKTAETQVYMKKRSGTIMLVDDEEVIREAGSEILKELGYRVVFCNDGQEAVEYYAVHHDEIDFVLLDIIMPRLSGHNCLIKLQQINPEVKVLVSSGYSINSEAKEMLQQGALGFIQKPFDMKRLAKAIRLFIDI